METTLLRLVANELNNTVAVCRDYYIHPKVFEAAISGALADLKTKDNVPGAEWYSDAELKVLSIINEEEGKELSPRTKKLNGHGSI